MAKKKVSQSALPKPDESAKAHTEVNPGMDAEKVEKLKSLNKILLKETIELRQQVDSLVQYKGGLEKELAWTNSEKEGLESELTSLAESAVGLELESAVVAVFVGVELGLKGEEIEKEMSELKRAIGERESEIGMLSGNLSEMERLLGNEVEVSKRVCLERDEIKCKLDLQIEEDRVLRSNLVESEERKSAIQRALVELRADYDGVVGEKGEMEMRIERISGEKDSVERCLVESNKLIEELKESARVALKEKEMVEEEKTAEIVRRQELENDVTGLNETVASLQKDEVRMLFIVADLEQKCFDGEERQKDMVEENKSSENKIKQLVEDKTAIERDLRETLKQFEEEKRKIEAMVNENIVLVKAKGRLESEVSALKKQVIELEGVVSKLEESSREGLKQFKEEKCKFEAVVNENVVLTESKGRLENEVTALKNKVFELEDVVSKFMECRRVEVEKISSLESEVGDYRGNSDRLKIEMGEMKNLLDEEKENGVRLKEKIGGLEDKIAERIKVYEKVKVEKASIFAEKVQLENRCGMLKKEITRLEDTVSEVQKEFDGMKGRAEITALVLKETAAAFCSSDDVGAAGDEEMKKAGVVELEVIKNAFKNRESTIDNMKKQMDLLQNSVEDAHKKKSFWTVLSSVTSLLAALSLAYVARGH